MPKEATTVPVDALVGPHAQGVDPSRSLLWGGVAVPLVFAFLVVLAGSRYPGYRHSTQAISELAAVDSPSPALQTLNFYVSGALTLAFALGLGRRTQRRLGAGLYGSLGAMMIAHGALPCHAGCEFVTPAGSAHNLLGLAGFSAAIAGVWLCGRQSPAGAFRTWSAVVAVTSLSSFVLWIALAKVAQIASLNGTLQRVFVAILLGWMFVTAVRELQGSSR